MRLSKHVLIVLITVFSLALSISNPWNRLGVKAYFSMEEIQKAYEIKTEKYKDNPNVKMLLQIHDELIFEVKDDYVDEVIEFNQTLLCYSQFLWVTI